MSVVLACLLNGHPDPQSGRTWEASLDSLTVLPSVAAHGWHAVVIHDCLDERDTADVTFVRVCNDVPNAYWARWGHYADWLDDHAVRWAWCVDAADVVMLNDPEPHMEPDRIYIGSEPVDGPNARSVGFWWMRHLHPDQSEWIEAHADEPLLNCGIVGGDRVTVRRFARTMSLRWPTADTTDMAYANRLVRAGRYVTGHPVHSPMWDFVTDDAEAWFAHK